ncbi:unnamed protein product [Wickerhamomyces anomalus]
MGRRSSGPQRRLPQSPIEEDDEDDQLAFSSRRKKQKVNYAQIENEYDDIDDELSDEDKLESSPKKKKSNGSKYNDPDEEEEEDDYDDDSFSKRPPKRSTRARSSAKIKNDEEEDDEFKDESDVFSEDIGSGSDFSIDEEKNFEKKRMRNFISKDDDDDNDVEYYDQPKKRSKKSNRKKNSKQRGRVKSRTTSQRSSRLRRDSSQIEDESEDEPTLPNDDEPTINDDNDDLKQELEDLKNDSDAPRRTRRGGVRSALDSDASPAPRSLRERKKEVNYTIPPPLTDINVEELQRLNAGAPSTPRRRGGPTGPIRRLFPTGGPFGGGDVTSIFGKNLTHFNSSTPANLLAGGGADSDSSDDEIIPVGGSSVKRNSISAPIGQNKIKKRQPADSDPLGVDMNIDFSAIGGLDNYINQLKEMVALPLLYPEVYQRFGITPPRGVLFHGPPGTGKTLMARALAASCSSQGRNITFFMRKGADCLSKWVGEAERQLRLLFEEARKQQPSIIFFDEIDGLAPVRSSKQEQIHASIVSTMLALMDGMDNRGQVIVIGATNRPDAVDPALRRPGRFDREFYFPLPDIKAREQIVKIQTKKWDPPLKPEFVEKVAHLTKGYGGADLRALCTEAALNSIQRRYPQIYASDDKLKIDPSTIQVGARDFMKALDKIVPSSARSSSSGSSPLPDHLKSLLEKPLAKITDKLDKLVPRVKKLSVLEEAQFVDPTENDQDGGFGKHELLKRLESTRVHRPRMLIAGDPGNGQGYLGSAVLNHLEGFNVQSLDLGVLFGDSTRSPETAIIQSFIEARRHQPSIIFIPNIDIWYHAVSDSSKATLSGLLRSVGSNERILLLGLSDTSFEDLDVSLKRLFGLSEANHVNLEKADEQQRDKFFESLWTALKMKPTEFLDSRKKRKLEKLEKIEPEKKDVQVSLKSFEKADMKLKNTLKIKLSGLMDLFKNRYRKFKKPPIDDVLLIHLFEPEDPNAPLHPFSKSGDMIIENSTQRRFFNMDLDIVEERLWNGFYSEPKQFLRDIEMIYLDAVTLNDRERLIKASEMFANAQVGVEEIATPEFARECKAMRAREAERQRKHEEDLLKIKEIEEAHNKLLTNAETSTNGEVVAVDGDEPVADGPVEVADQSIISVGDVTTQEIDKPTQKDIVLQESTPSQTIENDSEMLNGDQMIVDEPPKEDDKPAQIIEAIEEGPEPEPEPEPEVPDPDFILDESKLGSVRESLLNVTDDLNLESLELINARLMEIIWEDHQKWDRDATLEKLRDEIVKFDEEF